MGSGIDEREIERAADVLRAGGLVAFPTETVYGLGCDASSEHAVERLFRVKGRPSTHPVIVHLPDASQLDGWAHDVSDAARALAAACWPGPLTLVVRRAPNVSTAVTGGRDTVGLRVPDQPVARALLTAFGSGVAAPSANRFGRTSPTTAQHVRDDLGDDVDVVLDGGPSTIGIESTVVDCSGDAPAILRLGAVARDRIEQIVGARVAVRTDAAGEAPGTLPAHYAPRASVVVVTRSDVSARAAALLAAGETVAMLAPDPVPPRLPGGVFVLDPPDGADEYARVLYARMRDADRHGADVLLVVPPDDDVGVAAAVRDRLQRAAAAGVTTEAAR